MDYKIVTLKISESDYEAIERAVEAKKQRRSKLIRNALKKSLHEFGFTGEVGKKGGKRERSTA